MKENIDNNELKGKEKQDNKGNFMHIKSEYIRQNVFGYLKVNHAIKLAKNNKTLTKDVLEGYFAGPASYYDYFRYMFFVKQNTEIIYQICKDIFDKSLKDLDKTLFDNLKSRLGYDNANNNEVKSILFKCVIPEILRYVCRLEENDFSQLNEDDLTKVENLGADKTLQTLILTILERKSYQNDANLHSNLLTYLRTYIEEFLKGLDYKRKIKKLFPDLDTSDELDRDKYLNFDNQELEFRSAVYFKIVYKLLGSMNDDNNFKNYHHVPAIYDIYLDLDDFKVAHDNTKLCSRANGGIALLYKSAYYYSLRQYKCLDILFDGINDARECDKILEDYCWRVIYNDHSVYAAMDIAYGYCRAILRIFNNNKKEFVQYCEQNEFYNLCIHNGFDWIAFYRSPGNAFFSGRDRNRPLTFCTYKRLAGLITLWFLMLIISIACSPIGFTALFWFAFVNHILWLKIMMFIFSILFIWIWVPVSLIRTLKKQISDFCNYYTLKDDYLKHKYPILESENPSTTVPENCRKFLTFKTKIINLNKLNRMYESVNKMLNYQNQVNGIKPCEISENEIDPK